MKNTFLLFLATCGLLLLNSCQQDILETNSEDLQITVKQIPVEDEDISQFLTSDEKYPKAPVTQELLDRIAAQQSSSNNISQRDGNTACTDAAGSVLLCEDFDGLQNGSPIAKEPSYFEKWNPTAINDGKVVTNHPDQFLKIQRQLLVPQAPNEVDDILVLGDASQGRYNLSFQMYIGHSRTAYFDLQKTLRTETLAAFTFERFGDAFAELPNGEKVEFEYPTGEWFEVKMEFIINNRPFNTTPPFSMIEIENENTLSIEIAGQHIAMVSTTDFLSKMEGVEGSNQMQGIDFYPLFRSSKFYVDNVCFTYLGDPALGE